MTDEGFVLNEIRNACVYQLFHAKMAARIMSGCCFFLPIITSTKEILVFLRFVFSFGQQNYAKPAWMDFRKLFVGGWELSGEVH